MLCFISEKSLTILRYSGEKIESFSAFSMPAFALSFSLLWIIFSVSKPSFFSVFFDFFVRSFSSGS